MKGPCKPIDELATEKLPKNLDDAIGRIELVIETEKSGKILHIRATRQQLEIVVQWGKIIGLFRRLWNYWS